MPEEEKKQSDEAQAAPDGKATEDFKAKYEKLQAEHQQAVEKLRSAQGTLDTLDQYGAVDWSKISGGPPEPEPGDPEKNRELELARVLQRQEGRLLTLQFRLDNPDLREYEDDLVAPFVIKARQKNPRKNQDEVLAIAAGEVRKFLKTHEESVLAKVQKAKAKADQEKASGLETGGRTTPEDTVDDISAGQRYLEERRKRHAARTGAAL